MAFYTALASHGTLRPTWNEVGDVLTAGSSIGVGLSTGQSMEFDVTSHVELWADGTSNQGWVIKGSSNDCQAARIYNGSASSSNRPRLTVTFVPPDTTPPRIIDIDVGSSISGFDHDVPVGSGEQIRTVPVAAINRIYIGFDESVTNIDASKFSVTSANSGASYSFTVSSAVIGGNPYAIINLTNPVTNPDQLIVTAFSTLKDAANNSLDGEWSPNPTSLNSTGTKSFPSGNGTAGGNFQFYVTVVSADFNHDNLVNSSDGQIQNANFGMTGVTQSEGDTDGDGDVDGNDQLILQRQLGTNFTTW